MKKSLRNTFMVTTVSIYMLMGVLSVYANDTSVEADIKSDTVEFTFADPSDQSPSTSKSSNSFFSNWFLSPFKGNTQNASDKLLSNVKVFPNPTVETVNLSFRLGKRVDVSIKVMDALGNELMTLLSQTLDAGNQNQSFDVQKRLSPGLYFVKVTAGAETVIKRISVQ
jgi:hypothetical protein